ncbi:hypothetical protein DVB69_09780 [Sporosarcina sp. BI001-red]|uniref:hypothetical protein n=1 Tax=Sporosarcina sp. BI001-red TaxID=2282866 RepID=UPI000E238AA7|nr:hypothetical protein [Sporosarcina sp. BI001-red]REB07136.1 hypothetical protein DVB69_09780 [Sporosarcina sp. BI001-red]
MQKTLVKYILIVPLFFLYFSLFGFIWNRLHLGEITGDIGVLIGTLLVLILSGVLAVLTSDKIIEVIRK